MKYSISPLLRKFHRRGSLPGAILPPLSNTPHLSFSILNRVMQRLKNNIGATSLAVPYIHSKLLWVTLSWYIYRTCASVGSWQREYFPGQTQVSKTFQPWSSLEGWDHWDPRVRFWYCDIQRPKEISMVLLRLVSRWWVKESQRSIMWRIWYLRREPVQEPAG